MGNHQQQPANTKRWHPAAGQEGKQQGYFQPFRSVTCQRGWWVFFGMFVYRSLFIDQGLLGFCPFWGSNLMPHVWLIWDSAWSLGWRHRMTPCRHGPCFQEIAGLVRGLLRKYDGGWRTPFIKPVISWTKTWGGGVAPLDSATWELKHQHFCLESRKRWLFWGSINGMFNGAPYKYPINGRK